MKVLQTPILLLIMCLFSVGCGNESMTAISNYSGDGEIKYLPAPSIFGVDGIAVSLDSFDLAKNGNYEYSLKDLPLGDPYIIFLVVPDQAPLDEILKNKLHLKIYKNGVFANEINLPISNMINNRGAGLNRFYALKGVNGLDVSTELNVNPGEIYSFELIYNNLHVTHTSYGYILIERGGFK